LVSIKILERAEKCLARMGRTEAQRIMDFLYNRVARLDDPTLIGKPLKGNLSEYWCYRVGDYRLFCRLSDDGEALLVLVVEIGHRREVYK
jgi:addiction module toxin, RelE/StbE family